MNERDQTSPGVPMVDLSGKTVVVPNADAQQAFESRQFGFRPDDLVHVVGPDGQVGTVPSADAHKVFADGGRIATPAESRSAYLEAEHGGIGGTAAAFGEGVARGATFGLSDPLAVGVAGAFGHGREATEHLSESKEAHPIAAFGGEALGTVAPLVIPGGGAATAARFGEGAAAAAEGARALGAIPRGVAALGHGAERFAAGVVGETGATAAHRIAQAAVRKAAGAAIEGAAFGAGQEVSESALGDHELNGERLLAAVGHGALVGGVLGGAFGGMGKAAGEAGNAALRRLAPRLSSEAGEQAWKALSPLKKYSEEANARAGGTGAVGRTLLTEGVIPKEEGLIAAALTPEELLPRITAAKDRVGAQQGALLEQSKGVVSMRELFDPIDEVIKRESAKAGHEHIVASLERYRASLAEKLGLSRHTGVSGGLEGELEHRVPGGLGANDNAAHAELEASLAAGMESKGATAHVPGGGAANDNAALPTRSATVPGGAAANDNVGGVERLRKGVTAHIPGGMPSNDNAFTPFHSVHVPGGAAANENALAHLPGGLGANDNAAADILQRQKVRVPGGAAANENARAIPVQELVAQRKALDELVYKEAKSLDPNQRVALLREIRGVLHAGEVEAIDRAAQSMGGPGGAELRDLNRRYQHLRIAEDAAESSTSRMATNRNLSLSDYGAGIASAASGHPFAGPVLSIAHKMLRERGNAVAAVAMDRLSQLGMIQRASAQVDKEIGQAVKGYFAQDHSMAAREARALAEKPRVRVRTYGKTEREPESPRGRYESRVEEVAGHASRPAIRAEQVSEHLGGMSSHAPATVDSVTAAANRGTAFLSSKIPPRHTDSSSLTPHAERPRVSDTEMAKFLRYADAVDDPLRLVDDLEKGRISKESVEAVRTVYPKLYDSIRMHVVDQLTDRTTKLPYEQRVRLGTLLQIPADKSMTPAFQKALQASYGPAPDEQPKGSAPSGKKLALAESMKSASETMEGGK